MTAVVFIHKKEVREPGFSKPPERVTDGLTVLRGGLRIAPYHWGSTHGAALVAGEASLPAQPPAVFRGLAEQPSDPRTVPASTPDDTTAAWAALCTDGQGDMPAAEALASEELAVHSLCWTNPAVCRHIVDRLP
ncbi:hypothetical protein AB0D74_21070 [Streptomyces sp. NPDC048278]|uniref:hypothetical protein n=1 Tax=Streptomyces sp. NPDC048278 TaxID=3155809 RepID=UPI00343BE9DA